MAKSTKPKSVVVMFQPSRSAYIDKMYGLFRFIREHDAPWELTLLQPEAEITSDRIRMADGIILAGCIQDDVLRTVEESNIPSAFIALPCRRKYNAVVIESDGASLSSAVADEFLKSGRFDSFAFIHPKRTTDLSSACERTLMRLVEGSGARFYSFCEQIPSFAGIDLPCAVFALKDYLASETIALSRREGLRVPQDVSIIALANNGLFCSMSTPSITTISPDFEQQGYLAARELDVIMSSRHPRRATSFMVGPREIERRNSTNPPSAGESLVRRAMEYIRFNATKPITVEDVAKEMKVSRRLLEMRFKELRGNTINRAISTCRLKATKSELKSSPESISDICTRMGWNDIIHAQKAFKRRFGMTMSSWRKSHSATACSR